jgi:hypothetical protein
MNRTSNKTLLAVTLSLAGSTLTGVASAHDQLGQLGKKASATDIWEIECSGGSQYLTIQVKDGPPSKGPKLSVQVVKDRAAVTTTDPKDADAAYSPAVQLYGGDGVYTVLVDKSGAQPENYFLDYHCEGAGGAHTGTTAVQFQNQ